MHPDDAFYFRNRAEQQLRLAKKARHPAAAKAHYLLAGFYFNRFYNDAPKADLAKVRRSGKH